MNNTPPLADLHEARATARTRLIDDAHRLRARLSPRLLAADAAGMVAARALRAVGKAGSKRRQRIGAALLAAGAAAAAVTLRVRDARAVERKRNEIEG